MEAHIYILFKSEIIIYNWVVQIRQDLRKPEISKRILELKAQGKSFSEIKDKLNKEFDLALKYRAEVSNFYYSALKDLKSQDKMKVVKGELTKLDQRRQEELDVLMNQMAKINKILWSYYQELENYKKVLAKAMKKYSASLDSQEEPDPLLLREIRSTMTNNIANVSTITSNIMKQLELQSKTLGMLSRPTSIHISNLEIVTQINQVLKKIEAEGYYMVKPEDKEVFKKLIDEGKLKTY